jgi:hypothetical protein
MASVGSTMRRRESIEDSFMGVGNNPPVIGPEAVERNRSLGG